MKKPIVSKKQDEHQDRAGKKPGFLLIALMVICIFLSLAIIIRLNHGKPAFSIGESYYSMRMASSLRYDGFMVKDPIQGTDYAPNPYHYLLSLVLLVSNSYDALWFIPIILGMASAWLFFKLLIAMGADWEKAFYALLILSVTPIFIVIFTGLYILGWVIFLSLLSLVFLASKRKMSRWLGILCFLVLILSSLIGFVIAILALLMIYVLLKRKLKGLIMPAAIPLAVFILAHLLLGQFPRIGGFKPFAFKDTLSLLGASFGFDLFLLLIFSIGFVVLWERSKSARLIHLSVLLCVMLSFFNSAARAFTSFILAYYCVVAITFLYHRRWSLDIVKTGTMLLVLCSLVFSLANQVNLLVTAQPDSQLTKSLMFLGGLEPGVVLSDESYGFLVEFYSGNKVLLDENSFISGGDYAQKNNLSKTLFNAARLSDAQPLLDEHDIRYILITPEMKEQLWENNERGLWLLVKNSERFDKRYLEGEIEIREYLPAAPSTLTG